MPDHGAVQGEGTGHPPRSNGAEAGSPPLTGDEQGQASRRAASREPGDQLVRFGRLAWAVLGIAGLLVLGWLVLTRFAVVVIPLLLALLPAAMLAPAVNWLSHHRVPRPLATLLTVAVAVAVVGGVFALIVPVFLAQLPALIVALTSAADRLPALVDRLPWIQGGAASDLIRQGALGAFGGVGAALMTGLNLLFGLVLVVVVLICYLTSGGRIVGNGLGLLPDPRRAAAHELANRVWHTLESYTRALFLVALFDAAAVGFGLWLLGLPLVLPLAVLVFFGAFVPYIGAVVSGLAAVLVAFAEVGGVTALGVLALIIVVQQIEGYVVHPLLMGKVTRLSAFTVIVAVAIGAALLGVLGALLAVPTAACLAQTLAHTRERMPPGAS